MFLLVSGRHVGAHVPPTWRLHTNLYKFGENVSSHIFYEQNCCDLNLGESLCICTFFLFPDSGLNLLNGFDFFFFFFFIYFEWCDIENQQFGDHFRSAWGSFVVGDHLRRCTGQQIRHFLIKAYHTSMRFTHFQPTFQQTNVHLFVIFNAAWTSQMFMKFSLQVGHSTKSNIRSQLLFNSAKHLIN